MQKGRSRPQRPLRGLTATAGLITITHHQSLQPWPRADTSPAPWTAARGGVQGSLTSVAPAYGSEKVTARQERHHTTILRAVKWFSVRNTYGFINRNDTNANANAFVYRTAIQENNPGSIFSVQVVERRWNLVLLKEKRV